MASGPGSGIREPRDQLRDIAHFTGYVADDDLPALYRGADVLAYPSLYEGFGMPVLEGMAAGVPVVTSNVSSLPEVSGGAALEIDPLDSHAIAGALYCAITDQDWRRNAIGRGIERASTLTWERTAKSTMDVYMRLLSRRSMHAG